jgi:hypothetical protein
VKSDVFYKHNSSYRYNIDFNAKPFTAIYRKMLEGAGPSAPSLQFDEDFVRPSSIWARYQRVRTFFSRSCDGCEGPQPSNPLITPASGTQTIAGRIPGGRRSLGAVIAIR